MFSVLHRVAEARREKRAADLADVRVDYTVTPIRRVIQISERGIRVAFGVVFGTLCSVVAHVSAAVLVLMVPLSLVDESDVPVRTFHLAFAADEELMEEPPPELELAPPDKDPHEDVLASLESSHAPVFNPKTPLDRLIVPNAPEAEVNVPQPVQPLEGVVIDVHVTRKGSIGEEFTNVEGAVDRITHEIARNLEEKDVIVVWLMDASLSLIEERQSVAENLESIFAEINQLGLVADDELVHAVVAFGHKPVPLVEPTSKTDLVVEAIRNVKTDESGVENVFSAVLYCVDRYKTRITVQRRKMMIVIWTDESGDDYLYAERAVLACQKWSIPVFTVGPSAMFGKEKGSRPYVHPVDGKTYFLPVNRGPDALHQEQIELPFWFAGKQLKTLHSGLGPFALTRLAYETSGAYFIKDHNQDPSPYKVANMIQYAPEYDSVVNYISRVKSSPLRWAVMQAVELTRGRKFKGTPQLEFAPTAANFQQQLLEAAKVAAFNAQILDAALAPFGRGMEKEYEEEKSARWRAWYDYNFGRLLAMKVRNDEYNRTCAVFRGKGREFVEEKANRWKFVPGDEIGDSKTKKMADESTRLLTRCIEQNPGTPWATLAQRELRYPLGFKVLETYVAPPPPPKRNAAKAVPKPKPKKPKPKPIPKPPSNKRVEEQPRKLPRPKPVILPKL